MMSLGWDLRAGELWDGLFVVESVRGQLPRLWGPLGVNGTARSAAGSHPSLLSSHGTEPPAILAMTPNLKVLVGEDVTLECWVSGVPPPHITWYKGEAGTGLGSKVPWCTRDPPWPCRNVARGVPCADSRRAPEAPGVLM